MRKLLLMKYGEVVLIEQVQQPLQLLSQQEIVDIVLPLRNIYQIEDIFLWHLVLKVRKAEFLC